MILFAIKGDEIRKDGRDFNKCIPVTLNKTEKILNVDLKANVKN
ncbi:MAG: hypothetical protein ACXWFZ_06750 [Nitrososphaeraceae archaeon]